MEIQYLIKMVENLLSISSAEYTFKIYDTLSAAEQIKTANSINGIAKITNGTFASTPGLYQSTVTMTIDFIHPIERLNSVKTTLTTLAENSAGYVFQNSIIDASLVGVTGVNIVYPEHGIDKINTIGESITSTIICFFTINEKNVLANECTFEIKTGTEYNLDTTVTSSTSGTYYILEDDAYASIILPEEYIPGIDYYTLDDV